MQEYMERLMRCGIPPHDAMRLLKAMIRDFGYDELEELIVSIEREGYVA
jgi:hypothetical protein